MYIITYRAFKTFPSKESYINEDIAEWRYAELKNCVNADNVKMEIEEENKETHNGEKASPRC